MDSGQWLHAHDVGCETAHYSGGTESACLRPALHVCICIAECCHWSILDPLRSVCRARIHVTHRNFSEGFAGLASKAFCLSWQQSFAGQTWVGSYQAQGILNGASFDLPLTMASPPPSPTGSGSTTWQVIDSGSDDPIERLELRIGSLVVSPVDLLSQFQEFRESM